MSPQIFYDPMSQDIIFVHESGKKSGLSGPNAERMFITTLDNTNATIYLSKSKKTSGHESAR